MEICHTCDNPPCCNPKHLFEGTKIDNQRDCMAKGRRTMPEAIGEKNLNAKLTQVDVDRIKEMIVDGSYNTEIAQIFGVHHATISNIRRGKSWKTNGV